MIIKFIITEFRIFEINKLRNIDVHLYSRKPFNKKFNYKNNLKILFNIFKSNYLTFLIKKLNKYQIKKNVINNITKK